MIERFPMTVRYRVLCQPELGPSLGNSVFVGLNVEYEDQQAPVLFEGVPRRVQQIREMMDDVHLAPVRWFNSAGRAAATELRHVMESPDMQGFQPVLVAGAEVFGRKKPIEQTDDALRRLAYAIAELLVVALSYRWGDETIIDGSRPESLADLIRLWRAWREAKSADELTAALEARLPAAFAEPMYLPTGNAGHVVEWPRDADRIPAIARIVAEVFEQHSEPRAIFEDLQRRLARPA